MMPYTPSYYVKLLERSGFSMARDLLAWEFPTTVHEDPRLLRAAARLNRNQKLTVRPINLRRFDEEAELVRTLYNAAHGAN
ncbi:hypothetical protein ACOBQB_14680 [Streptomyces sp. G5(2025)]|uniref:hypothetical protein n=1 Tax=Streptomyces sp. G5(2025) TaxID=3406628 RepID=UPI003C1378A7